MAVSILTYGGSGNGTSDNVAALNAAIAAISGAGGQINFPAGKYLFSENVSYTLSANFESISFVGDGADSTVLYWPSGGGLAFTVSESAQQQGSFHIRDMTFSSGTQGGNALVLTAANPVNSGRPQSDITRVCFRGDDGYLGSYAWACGALIQLSNCNITGCSFEGSGNVYGNAIIFQSPNTSPIDILNISNCFFLALSSGVIYGNYAQGLNVSQSNFTASAYGVICTNGTVQTLQLTVIACQFQCSEQAINFQAPVILSIITSNVFLINDGTTGILYSLCGGAVVSNNIFTAGSTAGGYGIIVQNMSSQQGCLITGNSFDNNLQTAIELDSGSNNVNVQSNYYHGNSYNVVNNGTGNNIGGGSS